MRRLITKSGRQVYTWDENEKSDEQLAAEAKDTVVVDVAEVAQAVVDAVASVAEDVVEIAKVAVPTTDVSIVPLDFAKAFVAEISGSRLWVNQNTAQTVVGSGQKEVSVDNG